jgi:hypothetical protein
MVTRLAAAEARIDEMTETLRRSDDTISDLRRRLDAEAEERRKLTALLTDQRPAPEPRGLWGRFLAWRR